MRWPGLGRGSRQSEELRSRGGRAGGRLHTVTVSQTVVAPAGLAVAPQALVVLLALGSGLAGAPVVSRPPEEDYREALSPASGDLGLGFQPSLLYSPLEPQKC